MLKKAERIYKALEDSTGGYLPEACDNLSVCDGCSLRHICTAAHTRPETEIDGGELEEKIMRRMALSPYKREYETVNDEIKALMRGRACVLAGDFLVETKTIHKQEYTVKARDETRVIIRKI